MIYKNSLLIDNNISTLKQIKKVEGYKFWVTFTKKDESFLNFNSKFYKKEFYARKFYSKMLEKHGNAQIYEL